jgi:orotate phosphoribosyltransferase
MDFRKELEDKGCIYGGHFVGVSGKHLSGYCNIDPILPHVAIVSRMTEALIKSFADDGIETVVAPAIGAIPLSHWGAHHLEALTGKTVLGVWADKVKPAGFAFEREGFLEAVQGKRVLILEDMVNQMFSVKEMVRLVNEAGGTPVGVGAIAANKGVSAEAMGVSKFVKLCDVHYDAWTPEDCQKEGLCAKNEPIVEDIGHGDEFKAEHPEYAGGYVRLLSEDVA